MLVGNERGMDAAISASHDGAVAMYGVMGTMGMTDLSERQKLTQLARSELKLVAGVVLKLAIALLMFEGLAWIETATRTQVDALVQAVVGPLVPPSQAGTAAAPAKSLRTTLR